MDAHHQNNVRQFDMTPYLLRIPADHEDAPVRKTVYPVVNAVVTAFMEFFCGCCVAGLFCEAGFCVLADLYRIGENTSAVLALILEGVAAALAQESERKPACVLAAIFVTAISVFLACCDIIRRYKRGTDCRQFTFPDWFAVVAAVVQFITALIDYMFAQHGKQIPWNFSVVPLCFAASVVTAKLFRCRSSTTPPARYRMLCCGRGFVDLEVIEREQNRFGCVFCQLHMQHPH